MDVMNNEQEVRNMAVTITVECEGGLNLATIITERPDIAAQLVYEAAKTALTDNCDCEDIQALAGLLESVLGAEDGSDEDLSEPEFYSAEETDLNFYGTGNTGLSIEDSAERAASKVSDILEREQPVEEDDYFAFIKPACEMAISIGTSRHDLYELAGQIGKEYREFDRYLGIPLAVAFQHKVRADLGVSTF